jgi:hypothetical protein
MSTHQEVVMLRRLSEPQLIALAAEARLLGATAILSLIAEVRVERKRRRVGHHVHR